MVEKSKATYLSHHVSNKVRDGEKGVEGTQFSMTPRREVSTVEPPPDDFALRETALLQASFGSYRVLT